MHISIVSLFVIFGVKNKLLVLVLDRIKTLKEQTQNTASVNKNGFLIYVLYNICVIVILILTYIPLFLFHNAMSLFVL